jgi:hypothetical protein
LKGPGNNWSFLFRKRVHFSEAEYIFYTPNNRPISVFSFCKALYALLSFLLLRGLCVIGLGSNTIQSTGGNPPLRKQ